MVRVAAAKISRVFLALAGQALFRPELCPALGPSLLTDVVTRSPRALMLEARGVSSAGWPCLLGTTRGCCLTEVDAQR